MGFLPQQPKKRREILHEIAEYPYATIIYEAPQRLLSLLKELLLSCGDRKICICREISKLYEEHIYTTLEEINQNPSLKIKGEFCLVLDGERINSNADDESQEISEDELIDYINNALDLGLKTKDISEKVCLISSLNKREAYKLVVKTKKEREI